MGQHPLFTKTQLLTELTECNEFFDFMVDMIPSKLYSMTPSPTEEEEELQTHNNKYFYKTSSGNNKHKNQEHKEARRAAAKAAKRRKLNPETVETTSQLQHKKSSTGTTSTPKTSLLPTTTVKAASTTTASTTTETSSSPSSAMNKSRIELLREKLHAKIAEKQKLNPKPDPNQVSKRAARRAEKERRRMEAQKKKSKAATSSTTTDGTTPKYTVNNNTAETVEAQVAADLAQVDFGRLSGLNSRTGTGSHSLATAQKNYEQSNKALQNLAKTKNLYKLLAHAEAKQETLQQLKQGTAEEQSKAQQMLWSDTLKEADGQRIKEDPAKLKKMMKRKAAKKAKSQKAWQSRTAQLDKKLQDKQKIRQHNLQARKQGGQVGAHLSSKEIRSPSTDNEDQGRRLSRAGFEGRTRDFLNKGGEKQGGSGNKKKNQ
jgi:hypothetical protein